MIAKEKLDQWRILMAQSADLSRQKKTIDDQLNQLESEFHTELTSSGKDSIKRHGYTLAWVPGRVSVSWASEFLKACGPEKTQAIKDAAAEQAVRRLSIAAPTK